jgi:CRP-like cAMP-binding protein
MNTTVITCDPKNNHLLNILSQPEFDLIVPQLELIKFHRGEVVFDANERLNYVYFPISGIASLICALEDGSTVEVAMVGNDGMLGISMVLGLSESLTQVTVNQPMQALRLPLNSFKSILARTGGRRKGEAYKILLEYAHTILSQMAQAVACNRRHTIDQQFASWLLSAFDRSNTNSMKITQESISYVMGVRRESITEAAKRLQEQGMIEYRRGYIELKNRQSMENKACECYKIKKIKVAETKPNLYAANF